MGKWRGYKSYGSSALGIDFYIEGLDEYIKKIESAGNSIDDAVADAINQSAKIVSEAMKEGAERHRRTGDVVNAIETGHIVRDGNYTAIQVGIDLKKHPEAQEGVFQEYGDGHSPEFPDPFVRPALDVNHNKIKSEMRKVLRKWGVPVK